MHPSRAALGSAPRPAQTLLRATPVARTMTVAVIALGAGTAAGFKFMATTMRENEAAQRRGERNPDSLYVSVDRSGGGI